MRGQRERLLTPLSRGRGHCPLSAGLPRLSRLTGHGRGSSAIAACPPDSKLGGLIGPPLPLRFSILQLAEPGTTPRGFSRQQTREAFGPLRRRRAASTRSVVSPRCPSAPRL